jgi:TRAP-type transport system small permease protein
MSAMLARAGDAALRVAATALLLSLLTSVSLGVASRQLGEPLSWTDELAQYLLVWTGFAGWMIAARSRAHIRIGVFAGMFGRLPRLALECATQTAVALFGGALVWYSFALIQRNLDVESISVPWPAAVLYLPLPLLGIVLILQALADALAAVRGDAIGEGQVL